MEQTKSRDFVKRMLAVNTRHEIYHFTSAIELGPFLKRLSRRQDVLNWCKPFHQLCAYFTIEKVLSQISSQGVQRVAVYIESSQHDEKILKMANRVKTDLGDKLSVDFIIGGKNSYEPLQSADIVAYETYKQFQNLEMIRKPIEIINRDDNRIWSVNFLGDDARKLAEDYITLYDSSSSAPSKLHFQKRGKLNRN